MEFFPYCSIEKSPLCILLLLKHNTADMLSQYNLNGLSITFTICSPMTKFLSHIPYLMPHNILQNMIQNTQ